MEDEKPDICDHQVCANARELSSRVATFVQRDDLARALVLSIMAMEQCTFAEAFLKGMEPLRQAMIQIIAEDESEAIDIEFRRLLDG